MFSAAFPSVFDAASSDGTSDSESEQHTAIAPLSKRPLSDRLDTAATAMLGEMAEQLEVIEPPAKRARVPDLDTGVNAMLGEILSHELPPLDDGSLDGSLDVLRHEPPSLSTDLDFFLTNLETEIESTPSASPSVSPPLPLQPPAAKRKSGGGGGGGGGSRKDWEPWEDEAIRNFVESKGPKWRAIAAMLPGRSDDAVRNRWNRLKNEDAAAAAAEGGEVSAPPPPKPAAPRKPKAEKEEGGGAKPERVSWSRAEDATIVHSVAELGHKWYLIAQRLPGRTDHAIRNRYHRLQAMSEDQQILRGQYAAQQGLHFDGAPPAPPVGDPNLSAVLGPVPEILA